MIVPAQFEGAPNDRSPSSGSERASAGALYDENYYHSGCGPEPYERSPKILEAFGNMAENIIREFAPKSVLDAGCAHGFLVESLWDRGVRARGVDISEFAISQVRRDMVPHCSVGSLLESVDGHYDLVCCIEVLEHIAGTDVPTAIANICAVTDRILFSSTPSDLDEPTHCYVQPPLMWIDHFADAGFVVDLEADVAFVAPHAIAFKRSAEPQSKELRAFAGRLIRYRVLAHERGLLYFALLRSVEAARSQAETHESTSAEQVSAAIAQLEQQAATIRALESDNRELIAMNRALTEELSLRRRNAETLADEMQDLRAANIAYEVSLNVASVRLENEVRLALDNAHRLDQNINRVVGSPFWTLKTLVRRLRKSPR
jgi:SAM-dependent methyltransferase